LAVPGPDNEYNPIENPLDRWQPEAASDILRGGDLKQTLAAGPQKADTYLACITKVDMIGLSDEALEEQIDACASQADSE
jgi:hypothetical protein